MSISPRRRKTGLTREPKENQPVHYQHRPEDGQIEDLKPAAAEANGDGLGRAIPEFEFRQPPYEGSELVLLLGGQAASRTVLHALILFERRVEFGRYEGEEQV